MKPSVCAPISSGRRAAQHGARQLPAAPTCHTRSSFPNYTMNSRRCCFRPRSRSHSSRCSRRKRRDAAARQRHRPGSGGQRRLGRQTAALQIVCRTDRTRIRTVASTPSGSARIRFQGMHSHKNRGSLIVLSRIVAPMRRGNSLVSVHTRTTALRINESHSTRGHPFASPDEAHPLVGLCLDRHVRRFNAHRRRQT